jgi:hypothetical protein
MSETDHNDAFTEEFTLATENELAKGIPIQCGDCSTPRVETKRAAREVLSGEKSLSTAQIDLAGKYTSCPGFFEKNIAEQAGKRILIRVCHFKSKDT